MKNKINSVLDVVSPLMLLLGALAFVFSGTTALGYVLLTAGCVTGFISISRKTRLDAYEQFHLLSCIFGLFAVLIFLLAGPLYNAAVALLVLFSVDFLIVILDIRKEKTSDALSLSTKKQAAYDQYNEKKLMDELENIKDEFSHVEIYEAGAPSDVEELTLRQKAEEISKGIKEAIVVEDPKEGRFFYKESANAFHLKGCQAIARANKKELKSSNSRTELLAKGYKACKICNA